AALAGDLRADRRGSQQFLMMSQHGHAVGRGWTRRPSPHFVVTGHLWSAPLRLGHRCRRIARAVRAREHAAVRARAPSGARFDAVVMAAYALASPSSFHPKASSVPLARACPGLTFC